MAAGISKYKDYSLRFCLGRIVKNTTENASPKSNEAANDRCFKNEFF